MYSLTELFISMASGLLATTYGFSERFCGDVGAPVSCSHGAVTASGEKFAPDTVPSAAIAAPFRLKLEARWVRLKLVGPYPCYAIRVNDKMNPRFLGRRGFDLSKAAVRKLTSRPALRSWSNQVEVCK